MTDLDPKKAILPILAIRHSQSEVNAGPAAKLLGTGFIVGSQGNLHLISAKHVFERNPCQAGEIFAVIFPAERKYGMIEIVEVSTANDFDVAACTLANREIAEAVPLRFANFDPALNSDLLCFEYSTSRIESPKPGHTHISFQPLSHKGNIVRSYTSDFPERVPTPVFLTSFPALQGASGAPILTSTEKKNFAVCGMIIANVEMHLQPAQTITIQEGEKHKEETKYFLPYGKALNREVLITSLTELGIPFNFTE